jgi:hypothetical protein
VAGVVRKNSIRALLGVNVGKSRPVTMLQARPHAVHFKRILDFGEGQPIGKTNVGYDVGATEELCVRRDRGWQGEVKRCAASRGAGGP